MPDHFLGIDIGTGSTKAVMIDRDGKVIFSTSVSYPTLQPRDDFSEQAPELIWQAVVKCISRTVAEMGTPSLISFSSAMHSLLPVDKTGTPLTNLILWSDNRGADIANRIRNSALGELLYEQTGTPIHAMSPLCKIIWLRENEPELFSKVDRFISIKEYIWFNLFGEYEIDHSIASATGLFDIESLSWNENALSLCEISIQQLSKPVSTSYTRRLTSRKDLIIDAAVPFVIGASDGCLANIGSLATRNNIAALTIGTSGAIRVTREKPVFNFETMPFNYRLDEQTYVSGGPINNGGIALKWYSENFLGKPLNTADDYTKLFQSIADIPAGSDALIFLPYLLGERAPIWNSETCGVFFGITSRQKQAHFTKAVIEGISLSLYHVSQSIEASAITQINVSGGFVHADRWLQILADIFGKNICLINAADASAIGAAYLGMRSLGVISKFDEMKAGESRTFVPDSENHVLYSQHVFPRYERLYTLLRSEMKSRNDEKNK